jgi:hypothetical protein
VSEGKKIIYNSVKDYLNRHLSNVEKSVIIDNREQVDILENFEQIAMDEIVPFDDELEEPKT